MRAVALAILDSLVSGIVGMDLPVPLVGTLIGTRLGAFARSLVGDLWAGHPLFPSLGAGWGAAVGRFWGAVAKLVMGSIIVVLPTLAAFF